MRGEDSTLCFRRCRSLWLLFFLVHIVALCCIGAKSKEKHDYRRFAAQCVTPPAITKFIALLRVISMSALAPT